MDIERRQAPRHPFGGVAELSALEPSAYIIAKTTQLSRFGCFVRTSQHLPDGTWITLKITYEGGEFNAAGSVAYSLPETGLGISFVPTAHHDEVLLEEWLRKAGPD
jgi:hypothetical protein